MPYFPFGLGFFFILSVPPIFVIEIHYVSAVSLYAISVGIKPIDKLADFSVYESVQNKSPCKNLIATYTELFFHEYLLYFKEVKLMKIARLIKLKHRLIDE